MPKPESKSQPTKPAAINANHNNSFFKNLSRPPLKPSIHKAAWGTCLGATAAYNFYRRANPNVEFLKTVGKQIDSQLSGNAPRLSP